MAVNKRLLQGAAAPGALVPSEHFGVVLYEGDGTTSHSINGGKFGAAAYFNATNAKVSISEKLGIGDINKSWTISYWAKTNSSSFAPVIYARQTHNFNTQVKSDTVYYNFYSSAAQAISISHDVTNWTHVVLAHNGSTNTVTPYINGVAQTSKSTSGTQTQSQSDIIIGNNDGAGSANPKLIDQVRFFQKELSSSEVSTLYAETDPTSLDPLSEDTTDTLQVLGDSSCIATYRFENDEVDLSGNYDATGYEIQYGAGRYGQALDLNGTSSYAQVGTSDIITGTTFSVSIWVLDEASSGYREFFSQQADNNKGLYIGRHTNTGTIRFNDLQITCSLGSSWNHLVFTVNGSTMKTYQNGSLIDTKTNWAYLTSETARNGSGMRIGRQFGTYGEYWLGKLDQLRLFNKELSASEVTTLYNENSLVASYRFEGNANDDTRNYDGTASNVTYEYGLGFTPDLVWIKERSAAESHRLFDSSRGATKRIFPDTTSAESTATDSLTSFDTGGFSLGSSAGVNQDGQDYVAWCWKANVGTTSTNTDGTLTSTVQANQDAGFSIVKYTGVVNGSSKSFGHGLSQAPDMVIIKDIDWSTPSWFVWHKDLTGDDYYLRLNNTNAEAQLSVVFNAAPTSTVVNIGSDSGVGDRTDNYIAYCFHSVEGFSSFGSYVGNGSTDGPIVETGFEPAFVIYKGSSNAPRGWIIVDNKRSQTNTRRKYLIANSSNAEAETDVMDFLSNGFQIRDTSVSTNGNGETYIYMAFAADPDTEAPAVAKSFSTVTYTGTGSARSIEGLGFQPNLVFIKQRSGTQVPIWYDSVRGPGVYIYSSSTAAQGGTSSSSTLTSFDNDGFSLGTSNSENQSGQTYVAWAWKADDNEPTIDGGSALAVYKFEDNANDVTGNNNGTAYNVTYTSSGKFNKAASFNGSNSYVDTGSQLLQNNKAFTFSLWIKFSTSQTGKTLISRHNDATGGAAIGIDDSDANKIKFHLNSYNTQRINSTTALNDGNWHHIVGTWDTKTLKLYVDGLLDASSTPANTSLNFPSLNMRIGSWSGNTAIQYFEGDIDQVRIYSGAVSDIGVAALYAETASDNDDVLLGGPPETIISANANAGFSIIKYEGGGVAGQKIPHGLSASPEMIIIKNLDDTDKWAVYHSAIGATKFLVLNETAAAVTSSAYWNDTAPTSTVFTVGATSPVNSPNNENYIAYCFHSVSGFSDFGSYSGSGASGKTVTMGFQPDLVILKKTNGTSNWVMYDSVRGDNARVNANLSNAEATGVYFNFTSTGIEFTSATYNQLGDTYIYMAFKIN